MNVVVVGNGMVGSRFVDELVAAHETAQVTVLGREAHEPYNRVLLSSVVAGKTDPASLALRCADSGRVRTLTGVAVTKVDRNAKTVTDSRGQVHRYDRLVLATGSQARIPTIEGIATDRGLVPGVHVLKELDDATRIVGQLRKARRAVVLGAGVLGLEVATGLAAQGLTVTLVHQGGRLMERQLGHAASQVAAGSLSRLGVKVVTDVSIARTLDRRGALSAVTLTDGTQMLTELLVMCAGTIPDTVLARDAGLPCERGIVVGADLASPVDRDIFAIGDCAQPPEGGTGLVASGWEQASRLVGLLTADAGAGYHAQLATAATERGVPAVGGGEPIDPTDVVRVKALGLDVVTMGLSGQLEHSEADVRTVVMSDPAIGRSVEVVVSHGLLVGATVVGDQQCASDLSAMYTRMLPVPSDPAHLIVRPLAQFARPGSATVADMSADHTVCQCNSVPKSRIESAVAAGCTDVDSVARETRAGTGCGDCRLVVDEIVRTCAAESPTTKSRTTETPDIAGKTPALAGTMEG